MASKGAWLAGLLAAGAVLLLVTSDDEPRPAPAPSPTPSPIPGPPPPPAYLVGDWCSSKPSDGKPPMVPPSVVEVVNAKPDVRLPLLWLMIVLYVTKFAPSMPTAQRILQSSDPSNPTAYDEATTTGLKAMLGHAVGADKRRDLVEAYEAFTKRVRADDVPCPVVVPDEYAAFFVELMGALRAESGAV